MTMPYVIEDVQFNDGKEVVSNVIITKPESINKKTEFSREVFLEFNLWRHIE